MNKQDQIYIAGHTGLVGSALTRSLRQSGYSNLILRTHSELELESQEQVRQFFQQTQPDYVFLAAAKVGGILANDNFRGEFIYKNLAIQTNVIEAAKQANVKRLLFLGSSCIYPKECPQPMREEYLLTGSLEQTNEPYAVAKIAGIKLCEAYNRQYHTEFLSVLPTNLYGPNDNFSLETSHVIPALLRKFHDAKVAESKTVTIWGSGKPKREFLHVDDMAAACVSIMNHENPTELTNIGSGQEVTILELAQIIADVVQFEGELSFDTSKPDGTPQKLLELSRLSKLGIQAKIDLKHGLNSTYEWLVKHQA